VSARGEEREIGVNPNPDTERMGFVTVEERTT
jgi:hypothetical protein